MTVKELMEILSRADPDTDVRVRNHAGLMDWAEDAVIFQDGVRIDVDN